MTATWPRPAPSRRPAAYSRTSATSATSGSAGIGSRSADQPALPGPGGDLDPVLHVELGLHAAQVGLDRADRDEQLGGDLQVGQALRDQLHHLELARGQAGVVAFR